MKFGGRNLHSLDEVKRSESHIFQVADVWASLYLFAARESGRQEEAETKIKKLTVQTQIFEEEVVAETKFIKRPRTDSDWKEKLWKWVRSVVGLSL